MASEKPARIAVRRSVHAYVCVAWPHWPAGRASRTMRLHVRGPIPFQTRGVNDGLAEKPRAVESGVAVAYCWLE